MREVYNTFNEERYTILLSTDPNKNMKTVWVMWRTIEPIKEGYAKLFHSYRLLKVDFNDA